MLHSFPRGSRSREGRDKSLGGIQGVGLGEQPRSGGTRCGCTVRTALLTAAHDICRARRHRPGGSKSRHFEMCNISGVLCEKQPVVTIDLGGDFSRDELLANLLEFVGQGIDALTEYRAGMGGGREGGP
jgi:hypothetical protein